MTRTAELTPLLKRLQLRPMAATLPERIALARTEQLDYASFLEINLSNEVNRRAHRRIELRLNNAGFEETCRLEDFHRFVVVEEAEELLEGCSGDDGVDFGGRGGLEDCPVDGEPEPVGGCQGHGGVGEVEADAGEDGAGILLCGGEGGPGDGGAEVLGAD